MVIIHRNWSSIRKGRRGAPTACFVAARGSTLAGFVVLLIATSTIRPFATAPLAFALLEVNELKSSKRGGAGQQPVGSRQIDNGGTHGGQTGDAACFYTAQVGHSLSPAL